jgi:hypothetical protein
MYLRKLLVRQLLRLYPAAWRMEYGEEMRSMLLAQPLTASVIGDVFLNAMRQNLRRPDPWTIAALCLICWRSFSILLPSIYQLSPAAWALFVWVDRGVFLLAAFSTGCWTVINEGDVWRGAQAAWWSTAVSDLLPQIAVLQAIALAPDKTVPRWVFAAMDHLDPDSAPHTFGHYFVHIVLPIMLASLCGALLGHLVRTHLRRSTVRQNG